MPEPKAPKRRRLRNIVVKEISYVDEPANMRKFLFWKRDGETPVQKAKGVELVFSSDGTRTGTTLKVNGEALENVWRGNVFFGPKMTADGGESKDELWVNVEYTRRTEGVGKEFAEESTHSFRKAVAADEAVIREYIDDLPAALKGAVENLLGAVQKDGPKEETIVADTGKDSGLNAPAVVNDDIKALTELVSSLAGTVKELKVAADEDRAARKAADEAAAKAADKATADKAAADKAEADAKAQVESGELMEFPDEKAAEEALAAAATEEAINEVAESDDK